jgi:hypothetical protein
MGRTALDLLQGVAVDAAIKSLGSIDLASAHQFGTRTFDRVWIWFAIPLTIEAGISPTTWERWARRKCHVDCH